MSVEMSELLQVKRELMDELRALKHIINGNPDERRKGALERLENIEAEIDKQFDADVEGSVAHKIAEVARRERERAILLRGIAAGLGILTIGGGALQAVILSLLRELAARSS